ncbi:hypothetical protein, partial [Cronobacter sakazakii]|uniref:hypothetical protein n=1 Tax=Cronobacter sakazakii TaxID=28141 RepID=UPI002116F6F5
ANHSFLSVCAQDRPAPVTIPVNQHSGILIFPDRKKVIPVNFLTLNYKYAHKQTKIIHHE